MGKKKLKQYADIQEFENVFEFDDPKINSIQNNWLEFFKNEKPLILELGCGKGDYTINLAKENPNRNYIGIDIKGARLWRGAKTATELQLNNVCFLRCEIEQLASYFKQNSISEIWITFPDPFIRGSQQTKRLTSIRFLEQYERLLKVTAPLHLKTDSKELYDYTIKSFTERNWQIITHSSDVYQDFSDSDILCTIQTSYEKRYLNYGRKIKYIKSRLSDEFHRTNQ